MEQTTKPRRPLKWGKDGKLAEPAVKASVIFRPQIHQKATARAKSAGLSLSEYIASLVISDICGRPSRRPAA